MDSFVDKVDEVMVNSLMKNLGTFDGNEDLEIFILKFENIADIGLVGPSMTASAN